MKKNDKLFVIINYNYIANISISNNIEKERKNILLFIASRDTPN